MRKFSTQKKEKGQSIVEMALLLPVLLLMLMGLLDFGRVYYVMVALNDAAQEGAAYAASRPSDTTGIAERAASASTGLITVSTDDVSVTIAGGTPAAGAAVTVAVQYEFTFYTPIAQTFFEGNTVTLEAETSNAIIAVR
ncbi:MAG: pilus assembly protein [Anaerolineae bacterium]|nr:pilus assembly protein [Anaerolineae bacterium]